MHLLSNSQRIAKNRDLVIISHKIMILGMSAENGLGTGIKRKDMARDHWSMVHAMARSTLPGGLC